MRFMIHCLDKPDAIELRKLTRPSHLEYMSGFEVLVGGALLDGATNPCGSALMVELPDLAAAQEFMAGDPYDRAGLFKSVTIHQFNPVIWPGTDGDR